MPGYIRQAYGPGWALVGDAGFFRDPITSHGISDALRDAETLARAILDGSEAAFAVWQQQRDMIANQALDTTDAIAGFDWTLDELGERHRRFSAVLKAEVQALAGQPMPVSRAPFPASRTAHRAPANQDEPPASAASNLNRNRTGARP
ncbi:NAD(P)/FAD-dependent oxidoreductase [Mesorhizobium atlanticum]